VRRGRRGGDPATPWPDPDGVTRLGGGTSALAWWHTGAAVAPAPQRSGRRHQTHRVEARRRISASDGASVRLWQRTGTTAPRRARAAQRQRRIAAGGGVRVRTPNPCLAGPSGLGAAAMGRPNGPRWPNCPAWLPPDPNRRWAEIEIVSAHRPIIFIIFCELHDGPNRLLMYSRIMF